MTDFIIIMTDFIIMLNSYEICLQKRPLLSRLVQWNRPSGAAEGRGTDHIQI